MSDQSLKQQIDSCLRQSVALPFVQFCYQLLDTLKYSSQRRVEIASVEEFVRVFDSAKALNNDSAMVNDWQSIHLLFQITGDELALTVPMFTVADVDTSIYNSYLFFGIELSGTTYTRTQLATITRQLNKLFQIPVFVIYKYAQTYSIAIINRRSHLRNQHKDVLGKVTLIKDISATQPHRAHIEILHDLSLTQLASTYAIRTFADLHNAWSRVLDASLLNKRFYQELADWYFWALEVVQFPADAPKDSDGKDSMSVIRLVTRLMFCWFLKEKGLLPTAIFDGNHLNTLLFDTHQDKSTYYKAILQNLFFATLNQEMGQRGFRNDGQHFMAHNRYRYRELLRDPDAFIDLLADVPFMNGGLFECLDKTVNEQHKRIDGFSDRPDNAINIPNKVFFGEEMSANLETVYNDRSARDVKVRGLIHILNRYKFTITENTPIEEEIALDPELLGKVFENLLAAYSPDTKTTARNQTGSFYTPREIVDYMVDEAIILKLIESLTQLNPQRNDYRARLVDLVSYQHTQHQFDEHEVQHLIRSIDTLKILDPACGSGAFPMGILHKLVHILSKLDPNNQRWRQRQIDRIEKLEDIIMRRDIIEDVKASFSAHELDYGRKLYLIQNCIYGVDIQPIAVQISKLRFFISLLVNQQVNDGKNRGILPLPNLETNFIAANTLLKLTEQRAVTQRSLIDSEIDMLKERLRTQHNRYFSARTPSTKEKARLEDKRIREDMRNILTNSGWSTHDASMLANWNMYDQNTHADFFDAEWMFGIDTGFDIVIGNPPYLRIQGIQATQPHYIERYKAYKSATGNYDLYALFIERGYELLATGDTHGILAYIVPHKFFIAKFGEGLRKLLTERQALASIVKFGALQLFDEATTYSSLVFLSTMPQTMFDLVEISTLDDEVLSISLNRHNSEMFSENKSHPALAFETLTAPHDLTWHFSIGNKYKLLSRLKLHPYVLANLVYKIFVGLQTSSDHIYVLKKHSESTTHYEAFSEYLNKHIKIEKNMFKPYLEGRDVHKYESIEASKIVLFPYSIEQGKAILIDQQTIMSHYPLTWTYIAECKSALEDRENGRMRHEKFYAYIYPKNLIEFNRPKIMTPYAALGCQMSYDASGAFYHNTKVYSFIFKPELNIDEYYMLGILNSRVLWFFITQTGNEIRGGYFTFTTDVLNPFPIPESTPAQQALIATFVRYVLALKQEERQVGKSPQLVSMTIYFEDIINALVYELYFPEDFSQQSIHAALNECIDIIVDPNTLTNTPATQLSTVYKTISSSDHRVRRITYHIDSIPSVRVVLGKE